MKKKNNNAVAKSDKEELITALDIGSSHLRLLSGYVGLINRLGSEAIKKLRVLVILMAKLTILENWQAQ